jgi:hypothetical protein
LRLQSRRRRRRRRRRRQPPAQPKTQSPFLPPNNPSLRTATLPPRAHNNNGALAGRRRVTNTKQELYDAEHPDPNTVEYMDVEDSPVWDPDKGDLSQRVSSTFLQELRSNEISLEQTAYWFSTPPGLVVVFVLFRLFCWFCLFVAARFFD